MTQKRKSMILNRLEKIQASIECELLKTSIETLFRKS